jgi:hydrogenase/urease accessory protein HupE
MLGVEVGTGALLPLSDAFSLNAAAMFDGYFFGSDVPKGSAVIMFNFMLGATLAL